MRKYFWLAVTTTLVVAVSPQPFTNTAVAAEISWTQVPAQTSTPSTATTPYAGDTTTLAQLEPVTQPVLAQANQDNTIDLVPPVIEHDNDINGVPGEPVSIEVTVTDNAGVAAVTLHHRANDTDDYQKVLMVPSSDAPTLFLSTINTSTAQKEIQYYIEAEDVGGNRVFMGYPFRPVLHNLRPPVAEAKPSQGRTTKILLGVAGVIALGALLSGGSDGGPPTVLQNDDTRLQFNVSVPQ